MKDKLAEEILDEAHRISSALPLSSLQKHFTYLAMQRYHEAKLKEVTDADIEAYLKKEQCLECGVLFRICMNVARDMRNGEIKHIEK